MKKIALVFVFLLTACAPPSTPPANSFEDCVKLGNPVMESYPRQCNTEDGQHFVETLTEPIVPPKDNEGSGCFEDSGPVCALIQVQCIKAPCPPLFETIESECLAKERGSLLLGYHSGTCEKDLEQTCSSDDDCSLPMEFAIQSNCPFESRCIGSACAVVCPVGFR